jgi:D-alanine--poly(phosphoribitol) ligase subunit 2
MSTQDRIMRIFVEVLDIEVPSLDTDLIAGGLLDSLGLVTLLFEIEQEFAVRLPLEDLDVDSLRTTQHIASVVDELVGQSSVRVIEPRRS